MIIALGNRCLECLFIYLFIYAYNWCELHATECSAGIHQLSDMFSVQLLQSNVDYW